VRLYWEVARTTARRLSTYRSATIAGVFTNTVFGFVFAYVLLAVVSRRPVDGFDATDAVTFTFVSQGLLVVVGLFGADEIAERVRTGDVAIDLARPYDFQGWWAAAAYGRALFHAWARGVPPFLVGALVFPLRVPTAPTTWLAFVAAVALAVGVAYGWSFLLQMAAFWILDVRGPSQLGRMTAHMLAGVVVPLALFPDGVEGIVRLLPFAAMAQLPIEVFLGDRSGGGLVAVFAHQVLWLLVLTALGRLVLARATRRVVIHGG
jgi:ABC-2 type transport system permease protein